MKYIKILIVFCLLLLSGCKKESNNKLICEFDNDLEKDVITITYKDNGKTPVSMKTVTSINLDYNYPDELLEQLRLIAKQICDEMEEGTFCEVKEEDNKFINTVDIPNYESDESIDEAKKSYESKEFTCKKEN